MSKDEKKTPSSEGLQTNAAGPLAFGPRPDYLKADSARGREQIDRDDVTLPRLSLAQDLSPQVKKTEPKFIKGLEVGQMFNNLSGEVYGDKIRLIPVRMDKRALEFYPRAEGGGIKDRNVPWDDPRCDYDDTQTDPEKRKPKAERFYDFLCILSKGKGEFEPIMFSLSRTKFKVGKQLNGLIGLAKGDMWAGAYLVTPTLETSKVGNNKYFNFNVVPQGWSTREEALAAEALFNEMKGKTLDTEREGDDGADDTSFPPLDRDDLPRDAGRGSAVDPDADDAERA